MSRIPSAQKLTVEQKREFLQEHLRYEIDMLRWSAEMLSGHAPFQSSQNFINVCFDSFCMHARNLVDFFENKTIESLNREAAAIHFTKKEYEASVLDRVIRGRINNMAAHLSYRRVSSEDRITGEDIPDILKSIENELVRFKAFLAADFKGISL